MVCLYCAKLTLISMPWDAGSASESSEGLPGAAEPAFKMAHLYGCWHKASIPCHMVLSLSCQSDFVTWPLTSIM